MPPEIFLTVRVVTNARQTAVVEKQGNRWRVRISAKPVAGAANAALIDLLAQEFKVAKSFVEITHGLRSRQKRVKIIRP